MNQNWFKDEKFNQFWQSYSNVNEFIRNKKNIYYTYLDNFDRVRITSSLAHKASLNQLARIDYQDSNNQHLETISNENNIEFEINEDVLKFYRKSRKFKQEKQKEEIKRLKEINQGTQIEYVSGEQVKMEVEQASKDAPFEQAGSKREQELKVLYGSRANIIHLIETRLQMKHDRNLDLHQPKYWPSFPLKIKFN